MLNLSRRIAAKAARESRVVWNQAKMLGFRRSMLTRAAASAPNDLFGAQSDEFWFWCLTHGIRRDGLLRAALPSMPPAEVQERFTGSSGDATLREGWRFYRLVKQLAARYGRPLTAETTIVDFGCGWGRILRFFLKDVAPARLIGLDCEPEVAAICQRHNRWANVLVINPYPPAALPDQSVDLIYCYSVFSHLAEEAHRQWLAEFKRILRPGGLLIATTRPRNFILDCAKVREQPARLGRMGASAAFKDTAAAIRQYDAGGFCYSPVGGGSVLDSSFYGETCIPEAYVRREWTRYFTLAGWIDDRSVCHQNVIIMQA